MTYDPTDYFFAALLKGEFPTVDRMIARDPDVGGGLAHTDVLFEAIRDMDAAHPLRMALDAYDNNKNLETVVDWVKDNIGNVAPVFNRAAADMLAQATEIHNGMEEWCKPYLGTTLMSVFAATAPADLKAAADSIRDQENAGLKQAAAAAIRKFNS